MITQSKRNPLLPWFIGLGINLAAVVIVGVWMFESECSAPGYLQFGVLVIIPAVYMTLAYLTFKSQD